MLEFQGFAVEHVSLRFKATGSMRTALRNDDPCDFDRSQNGFASALKIYLDGVCVHQQMRFQRPVWTRLS
jgi:hypothetical protein